MSHILKQIRWQQRFINLQKSYQNLDSAVSKQNLNAIEQAGLIQYFEITFELSWKTLKDYLESVGITANAPRDVIKQSFAVNAIVNGEAWLEALEKRNLMSQTYQEEMANYAVNLIKNKYHFLFRDLILFLKSKLFPAQNQGFSLPDYLSLLSVFTIYPEIKLVKIFGSRAMGNFKLHSDVDLCLFGDLNPELLAKIQTQLSEFTKLPYQFDILEYSQISEEALKKHIDLFGKIIYSS